MNRKGILREITVAALYERRIPVVIGIFSAVMDRRYNKGLLQRFWKGLN
jgi:hypothetical protein